MMQYGFAEDDYNIKATNKKQCSMKRSKAKHSICRYQISEKNIANRYCSKVWTSKAQEKHWVAGTEFIL